MSLFNIPELGMKPKKKQSHPEQPVQKSLVRNLGKRIKIAGEIRLFYF